MAGDASGRAFVLSSRRQATSFVNRALRPLSTGGRALSKRTHTSEPVARAFRAAALSVGVPHAARDHNMTILSAFVRFTPGV